jgi:L-asparagine transporter-like permease
MGMDGAGTELGKSLRSRHVTMITVGGIIGAGLFVGSSTAISTIGPAAVISYALSGLVILFVMRMLSEMATAYPGVGSFTEYIRLGLGHWAGFTSGWLYWYFWVVVVPIEAIAGASILQEFIPGLATWQLGFLLMALMTGVNLLSARSFGEFEFWFSSIKVGAILAFVLIGGAYVCGVGAPQGASLANLTSHGGFAPNGWLSVFAGVTSVIFAFVGAEISTIAAAESKEPARAVAKLTSSVALRILLFFVVSIFLIVTIVPWNAVVPGKSPFAAALAVVGIPGAATLMKFVVLTAVLSCLNSGIYVTSRVLFTLAAKGDAPQALVVLNGRKVPARAILAGVVFGYAAMAASVLSPQVVFNFLVNASGAIALVNYLMVALAEIKLHQKLQREAPERLVLPMWFFPYASWTTAGVIVAVLVAMAITPDLQSQFFSSAVAVGVAFAAFVVFRRGK